MRSATDLSGVALVAKSAGPTSHDVVDVVRRALAVSRVGHLGTLDPFATGLLVLVIGRATRLAAFAGEWRKQYSGVIRLGSGTTTDDATGTVVATSDAWRELAPTAIAAALGRFQGTLDQDPPAYSAVHVNGERAYRRARRGERVALPARQVEVYELRAIRIAPPDVEFRAVVGAGTYLRSLARDIGAALGTPAHLASLRRETVGPFRLEDALAPETVTASVVRDPAPMVSGLVRRDVSEAERAQVIHGRALASAGEVGENEPVALFAGNELIAVAVRDRDLLKPRVVVAER